MVQNPLCIFLFVFHNNAITTQKQPSVATACIEQNWTFPIEMEKFSFKIKPWYCLIYVAWNGFHVVCSIRVSI